MKPTVTEMTDLSMWVHHTPSILNQGRLKHKEPKVPEGEEIEPEELMKREVAKDPWEPRLKPVADDAKTPGGMPAWIIRTYNTEDKYFDEKSGQNNKNYGLVVLKSQWWPGAVTFYHGDRAFQVYCGDGLKRDDVAYYPVSPPMMAEDREERPTYAEPNPTEEWLAKKARIEAAKAAAPE